MMRIGCALVVICVAGLGVAESAALGAFAGRNGAIAFVSDRRGADFDIWAMKPDGTEQVALTSNSKADDFAPSWRADGRKLAFNSDRVTFANPEGDHEIFVADADGSHVKQITFNALDDEDPAWSPDGSRIAFALDLDPIRGQVDYDLYTMRADGTRPRNLTNSPGVTDMQPSWSPDGRRLVFLSDRDGDLEVYTSRPSGADVRQLTFNDASEFVPGWSPDGTRIVFATDRDDGNFEIYTMRADGGHQTRLTSDAAGEGYPAWSPDGAQIVFATERNGAPELYTMRAEGGDEVRRTTNRATDIHPDWQPLP